jgi:hypothetical protein
MLKKMKKEMKKKKNLKWKDLENLMGNIIVNSISSQYVVYIMGYRPHMSQCPHVEGMRIAIFKSIKNRWRIFSVPQGRLFRPGLSNCYWALPVITENIEAPTLFLLLLLLSKFVCKFYKSFLSFSVFFVSFFTCLLVCLFVCLLTHTISLFIFLSLNLSLTQFLCLKTKR